MVGLAGINDLRRYLQESAGCGKSIPRLLRRDRMKYRRGTGMLLRWKCFRLESNKR